MIIKKDKPTLLFISGVISFLLMTGLMGCSESRHIQPGELIDQILLDYPSVLGYIRVNADSLKPFIGRTSGIGVSLEKGPELMAVKRIISLAAFPLHLIERIVPLCKEGTYISVILLDERAFGGPAAIHFEPADKGKLVDILRDDKKFESVMNSDPPEFQWVKEDSFESRAMAALKVFGYGFSGLMDFNGCILVENIDKGTLILPSYDVKMDFVNFLEDTNYLKAWGDVSLVINIEILRLAYAYGNEIREWNRSFKETLTRLSDMIKGKGKVMVKRLVRYLPESVSEIFFALEGFRFVSAHPITGNAELTMIPSNDGVLSHIMPCLRKDEPDVGGLMTNGIGIQMNTDPTKLVKCLKKWAGHYAAISELDPQETLNDISPILYSMSADEGKYLFGATLDAEGPVLVFLKTLDEDAAVALKGGNEDDSFLTRLLDVVLPAEFFVKKVNRSEEGMQNINCSLQDYTGKFTPNLNFVTCKSSNFMAATTRIGSDKPDNFVSKLLRLAKIGGGKLRSSGLPATAEFYFKASLPSAGGIFSGVSSFVLGGITGFGIIENDKLVIRFL